MELKKKTEDLSIRKHRSKGKPRDLELMTNPFRAAFQQVFTELHLHTLLHPGSSTIRHDACPSGEKKTRGETGKALPKKKCLM